MVKCRPGILLSNLETNIKPKFEILQSIRCSESELSELIANNPTILTRGKSSIVHSLSVLKGLVGSDDEVGNLVRISGWFLSTNLVKTMVPNVEFLVGCGIPLEQIIRFMYTYPRFILKDPEMIRRSVEKADKMGVRRGLKIFFHAVRVVSSMSNKTWEKKLQAFRDLGFSEEDILRVFRAFRQAPPVFSISPMKMKRIEKVVLATGKYDISCIINSPTALCRSIENWYKRRLQVLQILETKNLITDWPSFTTLRRMPEREFFRKFVAPYIDEVGLVYEKTVAVEGKKREAKCVSITQTEVAKSSGNLCI
ncbi:hypothetical protein ACS0TY_013433 [Phlomoides rotata]